jgi:hypothetical protein
LLVLLLFRLGVHKTSPSIFLSYISTDTDHAPAEEGEVKMVQFGRSAPPVEPPRQPSSTLPPHTLYTEPQNLKGTQEDLIIPPQFRRYCLMGFGAQVVLDILVILVVYFQPAAFLYVSFCRISSYCIFLITTVSQTSTIPVACLCLVLDFAMLVWTYRATPRPIDVLMKNALSGVAWFMLAVINGSIISEIDNPWPPFVISLFTL